MTASETIAEAIKRELESNGLSQGSVARALSVTPGAVWQSLNGKRKLVPDLTEKMLEHLGLELTITPRQDDTPRLTAAGVPFTGDEETDWWLENQPDILERVAQHREGENNLVPIADIAKRYGVKL